MLKLHLVDLSIRYTTNFATNTVTNRTDGTYALVYGSTGIDRHLSPQLCRQKWVT